MIILSNPKVKPFFIFPADFPVSISMAISLGSFLATAIVANLKQIGT
jgi:hypothetical protein